MGWLKLLPSCIKGLSSHIRSSSTSKDMHNCWNSCQAFFCFDNSSNILKITFSAMSNKIFNAHSPFYTVDNCVRTESGGVGCCSAWLTLLWDFVGPWCNRRWTCVGIRKPLNFVPRDTRRWDNISKGSWFCTVSFEPDWRVRFPEIKGFWTLSAV